MTTPKRSLSLLALSVPIGSVLTLAGLITGAFVWFHSQEFVTRKGLDSAVADVQASSAELRTTIHELTARVSTLGESVSELRGRLSSR